MNKQVNNSFILFFILFIFGTFVWCNNHWSVRGEHDKWVWEKKWKMQRDDYELNKLMTDVIIKYYDPCKVEQVWYHEQPDGTYYYVVDATNTNGLNPMRIRLKTWANSEYAPRPGEWYQILPDQNTGKAILGFRDWEAEKSNGRYSARQWLEDSLKDKDEVNKNGN